MPEPQAFLNGFGFIQGSHIGGFILNSAHASHHQIRRYREYSYDITLTLHYAGGDATDLYYYLDQMIAGSRVINSAYGNPYRCSIDPHYEMIQDPDTHDVEVYMKGHSYRV